MGDQGKKLTRAKSKREITSAEAGRGAPQVVTQNLKKLPAPASQPSPSEPGEDVKSKRASRSSNPLAYGARRSTILDKIQSGHLKHLRALFNNSAIANISTLLDIEEFEFPDDQLPMDPAAENAKLDVTALDRYNDDIRKLRRMLIDECKGFPQKGEPDEGTNRRIKGIVRSLCRSAFYSSHNAQVLAVESVTLIVWLLNKRNLSSAFKVHLMQSFTEMVWTCEELKLALFKCNGIRVIVRLLVRGVLQRSDQARWACYILAMASVGCREIIEAIQAYPQLEEVVGEIAFHAYWANWPANFGQILQGILFGPHSVIPVEDCYQFL